MLSRQCVRSILHRLYTPWNGYVSKESVSRTHGMNQIHHSKTDSINARGFEIHVDHQSRRRSQGEEGKDAVLLESDLLNAEVAEEHARRCMEKGIGQEWARNDGNALLLCGKEEGSMRCEFQTCSSPVQHPFPKMKNRWLEIRSGRLVLMIQNTLFLGVTTGDTAPLSRKWRPWAAFGRNSRTAPPPLPIQRRSPYHTA